MSAPLPHVEVLKWLFKIDSEGRIRKRSNGRLIGTRMGDDNLRIYIDGKYVSARRVAWKMQTGMEPRSVVQFIDPDVEDYRIRNLKIPIGKKIKAAGH